MLQPGDEGLPPPESAHAPLPSLSDSAEIPLARPIVFAPGVDAPASIDPFRLTGSRGRVWLEIGAFLAGSMVVEILAQTAIRWAAIALQFVPADVEDDSAQFRRVIIVPVLFTRAVAIRILLGVLLRTRRQPSASIGLTRRNLGVDVAIGVATTAIAYAFIGAALLVMYVFWPEFMRGLQENAGKLITVFPKLHPAMLGVMAIAIGYYEELVFRGFLMTRLRHCTGGWIAAVILTTALFTVLHAPDQTAPALVVITILSLVLSVVTIWRRSLVPAVVAHALFDFSQFMLLYFSSGDAWK